MLPPIPRFVVNQGESGFVEVNWIDWRLVSSPACNELRMTSIDPVGLHAPRFFKTPGIGVRNADLKRPDLC